MLSKTQQKTDSGDSGNEEPHGEADFYVKREPQTLERLTFPSQSLPKVDKLGERINTLSCPRDYLKEKVPDGLFDALPPEGRFNF